MDTQAIRFPSCLAALALCTWSLTGEMNVVSPKRTDGGNGSADAPCASIDKALKRASARNNIFYKGSKGGSLNIANKEVWAFSNNCWPDGVPDVAKDPASFKADPQFLKPDDTVAEGFKLTPGSPCLGKALPLPEVTTDYWGTPRRKTQLCVGLHEWMPPDAQPEPGKTDQPRTGRLPFVP